LRAETNAEERLVLLQRHGCPLDFATYEFVVVVGAHRAAENNCRGMIAHSLRQRIAKARPAHVKPVPEPVQRVADSTGRGMFLVQNDQDRQCMVENQAPRRIFYRFCRQKQRFCSADRLCTADRPWPPIFLPLACSVGPFASFLVTFLGDPWSQLDSPPW